MDEQGIKKARKPRPRYMGVVKSFNRDKGFGFIRSSHDGRSYFFHMSQFVDDVPECGMVVEFMIYTNEETGKQCCSNCLVVEYPPEQRKR